MSRCLEQEVEQEGRGWCTTPVILRVAAFFAAKPKDPVSEPLTRFFDYALRASLRMTGEPAGCVKKPHFVIAGLTRNLLTCNLRFRVKPGMTFSHSLPPPLCRTPSHRK